MKKYSSTQKNLGAHIEIMLTENGPLLIEAGARMCGGPTVRFAREATGSSQADKIVEIFTHGDVLEKKYIFSKTVMPVFLKSPQAGKVLNAKVFENLSSIKNLYDVFIWFKEGDTVPETIDYVTSIGIIALAGERDKLEADYRQIRKMERELVIA